MSKKDIRVREVSGQAVQDRPEICTPPEPRLSAGEVTGTARRQHRQREPLGSVKATTSEPSGTLLVPRQRRMQHARVLARHRLQPVTGHVPMLSGEGRGQLGHGKDYKGASILSSHPL